MERKGVEARSSAHTAIEGYKGMLELRDGTRKSDKQLVIHLNLHPTNQPID
jgi:hypothetical protein